MHRPKSRSHDRTRERRQKRGTAKNIPPRSKASAQATVQGGLKAELQMKLRCTDRVLYWFLPVSRVLPGWLQNHAAKRTAPEGGNRTKFMHLRDQVQDFCSSFSLSASLCVAWHVLLFGIALVLFCFFSARTAHSVAFLPIPEHGSARSLGLLLFLLFFFAVRSDFACPSAFSWSVVPAARKTIKSVYRMPDAFCLAHAPVCVCERCKDGVFSVGRFSNLTPAERGSSSVALPWCLFIVKIRFQRER